VHVSASHVAAPLINPAFGGSSSRMTPNGVKLATQNTINALALKTSELVNFPLEAGLITKKV
jgi:hypothetical protein